MEITYKRELDHNYLILWQDDFRETYQAGMLVKNRIPGLLQCRLNLLDQKAAFYYEITSRQSLRIVLERKRLRAEHLEKILEELKNAVENARKYLLDIECILINPDYIYLEPDTWELRFCLCPFCEQDMQEELLNLAEYLLEHLDRQDQRAVTLGYEFYRMAGEVNASLERVLKAWKQGAKKELPELPKEKESIAAEELPQRDMGTQFLKRKEGLLLRSENLTYPDVKITRENFLIGKKKDAVDGWIKARSISRIHGKIVKEAGEYYLVDLNSTNGTYLNGGRLEVNEKARIRPGDEVGFAELKYVVDFP